MPEEMMPMRNPVQMETKKALDEGRLEEVCTKVVASFDRYLDCYPSKNRRTKHGVMGPVARVIDLVKMKGASVEHAVGFALRMHEMNPRAKGYVSREALEALEAGTRDLVAIVDMVPAARLPRVLERIDYALYHRRRKMGIAWVEEIARSFAEFSTSRNVSFPEAFFPPMKPEKLAPLTDAQRDIVREFWEERPDLERAEAEEEDEEEPR
jgi:hypothetical protein